MVVEVDAHTGTVRLDGHYTRRRYLPRVHILSGAVERRARVEFREHLAGRSKFAVYFHRAGILHPIVERMTLQPVAFVECIQGFAQPFFLHGRVGLGVRTAHLRLLAVLVKHDVEFRIALRAFGVRPPFVSPVGAVVPFRNPHGASAVCVFTQFCDVID